MTTLEIEQARSAVSIDTLTMAKIIETTQEHLLITDEHGRILSANDGCGSVYGVSVEDLCATDVQSLERDGVLSPSVTLRVLNTGQPAYAMQVTPTGRRVLAEAYPVFVGDRLVRVVSRSRDALDLRYLQEQYSRLSAQLGAQQRRRGGRPIQEHNDRHWASRNPAMREAIEILRRIAPSEATVMLLGETGSGKTALAHQIHYWSTRSNGPFIDVNCSAIPESLFESEMFGCMPGAFSGAPPAGRPGLLEQAAGGTLLLDEIGELPWTVQAKLLKVLQSGQVTRLGDTKPRALDFRLIVATNRDLPESVEIGAFRRDLFYRLYVVPVRLPALRERPEDILILAEQHMARLDERYGGHRVIDETLRAELLDGYWRGNIRELENFLERYWLAAAYPIAATEPPKPSATVQTDRHDKSYARSDEVTSFHRAMIEAERRCLENAGRDAGTTYEIARRLGISQSSVVRKLKKHGLKLSMRGGRPVPDHETSLD